jgi:hypothetical protein
MAPAMPHPTVVDPRDLSYPILALPSGSTRSSQTPCFVHRRGSLWGSALVDEWRAWL